MHVDAAKTQSRAGPIAGQHVGARDGADLGLRQAEFAARQADAELGAGLRPHAGIQPQQHVQCWPASPPEPIAGGQVREPGRFRGRLEDEPAQRPACGRLGHRVLKLRVGLADALEYHGIVR